MSSSFQKIFHPQSVAVIGAALSRGKLGNTVVRNLLDGGFTGPIYPVNPKYDRIEGLQCFSCVGDIQTPVDLAVICTPAATVSQVIRQCGQAGIMGVVILTAGFRETGTAGAALEQLVQQEIHSFPGMRVIGPNCVGIIASESRLNASFARGMPSLGHVSLISQSGALCTAILDWAQQEGIGFANFVSVGNMVDTSFGDLIENFANDPLTHAIVVYIESIDDAEHFMVAASQFTRNKPLIAYKAGRHQQSAAAASSHTGAMAGDDAVYDAAFRRAGITRVYSIEEMFDCAEVLGRETNIAGPRLAVVTNAGGPGVMATDALMDHQGELAELSPATLNDLNAQLPSSWSKRNPVDVIGDATAQRLGQATKIVLADPGVDAVLVIVSPQAMTDATACAQAVIEVAKAQSKPVLTSWLGGVSMVEAIELLNKSGIPTFPTPERAAKAFMDLVRFKASQQRPVDPADTSPAVPRATNNSSHRLAAVGLVDEIASKKLLADYGISVAPTRLATTEDEVLDSAALLGYPVAIKIVSPGISHKSDFGCVFLNLHNQQELLDAYCQTLANARTHAPNEKLLGVAVQPMVRFEHSFELIVGVKRDLVFGPVLMVGSGGVYTELLRDVAIELLPINQRIAQHMLQSLMFWPVLAGFRGKPPLNVKRIVDTLLELSELIGQHPEIEVLEINPLLISPDTVIALDARIIVRG
jgi:acetyltransferase